MLELKDLPNITEDDRPFYEKWQETEGLDVIKGMCVEDLRKVPLKPWKRKGGFGVFINLEGTGGENDAYVCEIPPGGLLLPQKHLFEELIFILEGRGSTTVWHEGGAKQSFEWQRGSLFSPPLNTRHQHFNAQGNRAARYLAVTLAPVMMNILHNTDFIFNNSFQFIDRFGENQEYFSGKGRLCNRPGTKMKIWETNFISDVLKLELIEWKERGAGRSLSFELSENGMAAHTSRFPVGTYKKAHRHQGGAHVTILSGEGYTLMWKEGDKPQRYDWRAGSLIVPPEMWFHQHFNIGEQPAHYLALHARVSKKHRSGLKRYKTDQDIKEGGDQIEYEDENPMIREMFETELAKRNVQIQMPKFEKRTK
jgi:oxalate decarboxylase/phosphoglucose isomerase-like protein (cupin superfamily)